MKLRGNTILITGGTSGIGLGFAKAFLKKGNKVIICGRRKHRLEQIEGEYPEIITRMSDVSKDEEREDLFNWVAKDYPETNVLVNNAGIQRKTDLTKPVDMTCIHAETDINFHGPVHLSSLFVKLFSNKERAAIINISSGLAFTPIAWMPIYCATKAALHSFSLSIRHQLRNTSIKVFEIIPPSVDTELGHDYRSDPNKSHGGMSISEFIDKAMNALEENKLEYAIGQSKNLHARREQLFDLLNQQR
ncbi:MAG: SDR family NAD(P)-dependent oxidoreductase [Balneolaceae bacterium]|jgi:uncharacterized oxidoreductase